MRAVITLVVFLSFISGRLLASSGQEDILPILKKVHLSEQQKNDIKKIRLEMQTKLGEEWKLVSRAQDNLDGVLDGETSDDSVRSAHEELLKRRDAYEQLQLEYLLKIRTLLTPEQRKTFSASRPRGKNGNQGHPMAPIRQ